MARQRDQQSFVPRRGSGYRPPGFADQTTDRLPVVERAPQSAAPQRLTRQPAAPRSRPERRGNSRRGSTLLIWLVGFVAIAIILVIGIQLASDNIIKPMVADRVEDDINSGVENIVGQQLEGLPVSVDQPQEVMVSEAELNQRIDEQQNLGPLDDARTEINSDGLVVHMEAYGLSGTYRAQLGAEGGRAVLQGGSMSGPLKYVIPVEDLERTANDAIARSLVSSDIQVTGVTLVDGEMVLTLESTGAGNGIPTG